MKEPISNFDFEAAFKALDEIEIPVAEKVRPNRLNLKENLRNRKMKTDLLIEDYYDVSDTTDLEAAQGDREAEVAKAKLARIEKIVDLNAETAEDLLTSYVGKFIIQCPQCMTLFYKNEEDIEKSEDNPEVVNIAETCQHCGNDTGYTLIGKVGEVTPDEMSAYEAAEETTEEASEELAEEPVEETAEEESSNEEVPAEDADLSLNLDELDLDTEEKTEESFEAHSGELLVEDIQDDADLDASLKAHTVYVEYLRDAIAQEEKALEETDNAQIKAAIQRRIDAFKADLEAALPEAVKTGAAVAEETSEETPVEESLNNSELLKDIEKNNDLKTENESEYLTLNEAASGNFKDYVQDLTDLTGDVTEQSTETDLAALKDMEDNSDIDEAAEKEGEEVLLEKGLGLIAKLTTKNTAGKVKWLVDNAKTAYYKNTKVKGKEFNYSLSVNTSLSATEKDIYKVEKVDTIPETTTKFFGNEHGSIVVLKYTGTEANKQDPKAVFKTAVETAITSAVYQAEGAIYNTYAEAEAAAKAHIATKNGVAASIYLLSEEKAGGRFYKELIKTPTTRTRPDAILTARYIKGDKQEDAVVKNSFDQLFNRFVGVDNYFESTVQKLNKEAEANLTAEETSREKPNTSDPQKAKLAEYQSIFTTPGYSYKIKYTTKAGTYYISEIDDKPFNTDLTKALAALIGDGGVGKRDDVTEAELWLINKEGTQREKLPIVRVKTKKIEANNLNTLADRIEDSACEWEALPDDALETEAEPLAEDKITVTFDTDGGTAVEAQTITKGSKVTKPADPTKDGFTFKEWVKEDDTPFDFETALDADLTLKATWAATEPLTEEHYQVSYKAKDVHTGKEQTYTFVFKTRKEAEDFIADRKGSSYNPSDMSEIISTTDAVTFKYDAGTKTLTSLSESFKPLSNNVLLESFDNFDESFDNRVTEYLHETYSNVKNYESTNCQLSGNNLVVEGIINFNSGKTKKTKFNFVLEESFEGGVTLIGTNTGLAKNGDAFGIVCKTDAKSIITEQFHYYHKIGETLVEGFSGK